VHQRYSTVFAHLVHVDVAPYDTNIRSNGAHFSFERHLALLVQS
jgi:hypothetical protein